MIVNTVARLSEVIFIQVGSVQVGTRLQQFGPNASILVWCEHGTCFLPRIEQERSAHLRSAILAEDADAALQCREI